MISFAVRESCCIEKESKVIALELRQSDREA
jgi:hypothetical protein